MTMKKTIASVMMFLITLVVALGPGFAQPKNSEFLSDLPAMKPYPAIQGVYYWEKEENPLRSYKRFILDPVQFFIHPQSSYKGIKPGELQIIGQALRAKIMDALEPDYAIVNKPGPGIARLRYAVTDLRLRKKSGKGFIGGPLKFVPSVMVINTVAKEAGKSAELNDATTETEILDSVTGERLVVAIDPKKLRTEKEPSWDALISLFTKYATQLKNYIDEAHH